MPILLTNAFDAGDFDTVDYGEVKVQKMVFDLEGKQIILEVSYGNTVNGVWVEGKVNRKFVVIADTPARGVEGEPGYLPADLSFSTMVAGCEPEEGESVYVAVKRSLYEYLLDNEIFIGTIS